MLAEMSSRTFAEWMAYYQIEPFGDELIDLHFAQVETILVNTNRKKNAQPVKPQEFRLWKKIRTFDPQAFYENLKSALMK